MARRHARRPGRWRGFRSAGRSRASTSRSTIRENLLLEAGYRDAARANLMRRPEVYAGNVLRSLWSYHVHTTAAYLPVFRHYQQGGTWPRWGTPGTDADPATWPGGAAYRAFGGLLTLLAFAGAGLAVYRRDVRLLPVAALHVCLAMSHALSWMDFTYLYLRLPFDALFAMYLIDGGLGERASAATRLAGIATAATLVGLLGASTAEVFFL